MHWYTCIVLNNNHGEVSTSILWTLGASETNTTLTN